MQQPSQGQTDTSFGYGLATPTSNPDNALGQNQGYSQTQGEYGTHAANSTVGQAQYHQDVTGDFGSYDNRSTTGDPATSNLHPTAQPTASGLSFDHLPQATSGQQYQTHQPASTTQSSLGGLSNLFDVSGAYSTSGGFEPSGLPNAGSMSTLNSEWSGAPPYGTQTPGPGQPPRLPQQQGSAIEGFGGDHHSSGYPTPQTNTKWSH